MSAFHSRGADGGKKSTTAIFTARGLESSRVFQLICGSADFPDDDLESCDTALYELSAPQIPQSDSLVLRSDCFAVELMFPRWRKSFIEHPSASSF